MAPPQLYTRSPKAAVTSLTNRQKGIFKKSNTLRRMHGGEVAVLIKQQDGQIVTFETQPGILHNARSLVPNMPYGPDDFDTIKERRRTPTTISMITSQFFDSGNMMQTSLIDSASTASMIGPPATLPGDITQGSVSSNEGYALGQDVLGCLTSEFSNADWQQIMSGPDEAREETFPVSNDYVFPSSLLPKLQGEGDGYELTSSPSSRSSSTSTSTSSSSSSSPTPSMQLPSDSDCGVEQGFDSLASPQPISPKSQKDLLAFFDEYTKE
ncbi:hypothetical protein F5Y17DRAFT_273264 [Xylariaceae sp. FL0594]|nr:hypothetical protein F5Y17DRAFT_273264 [Xylariaceae sp. FL0594]